MKKNLLVLFIIALTSAAQAEVLVSGQQMARHIGADFRTAVVMHNSIVDNVFERVPPAWMYKGGTDPRNLKGQLQMRFLDGKTVDELLIPQGFNELNSHYNALTKKIEFTHTSFALPEIQGDFYKARVYDNSIEISSIRKNVDRNVGKKFYDEEEPITQTFFLGTVEVDSKYYRQIKEKHIISDEVTSKYKVGSDQSITLAWRQGKDGWRPANHLASLSAEDSSAIFGEGSKILEIHMPNLLHERREQMSVIYLRYDPRKKDYVLDKKEFAIVDSPYKKDSENYTHKLEPLKSSFSYISPEERAALIAERVEVKSIESKLIQLPVEEKPISTSVVADAPAGAIQD